MDLDAFEQRYFARLEDKAREISSLISPEKEVNRDYAVKSIIEGIKALSDKYGYTFTKEESRFEATEYPFFDSLLKTNNLDHDLIILKIEKGGANPLSFWVNIIDYSENLDLPEEEKIKISSSFKPVNCNYFEYKKVLSVVEVYLSHDFSVLYKKLDEIRTRNAVKAKQREIARVSIKSIIKVLCDNRCFQYEIKDYMYKSRVEIRTGPGKHLILDLVYSRFSEQVKDIEKAIDAAIVLGSVKSFVRFGR